MKTYPNQKVIHIQKRTYEDNFLQVGNDEWQRAARELSGSAFKLYLYLAGNKDGFELALSQKAVEDTTGLSKNTYHRAVEELETKGYLSSTKGNVYVFSPSPSGVSPQNGYIPEMGTTQSGEGISPKLGEVSPQNGESILPKMGREIDKTYNIDKIDSEDEESISPEKKNVVSRTETMDSSPKKTSPSGGGLPGRRIRDLSEEEAKEIKAKLKQGIRYLDIESEYGMRRGTITSKFEEHWKQFLWLKVNGRI